MRFRLEAVPAARPGPRSILLAAAWAAGAWLVPALIVAGIRKHYGGHVAIRGWWLGPVLRPASPAWSCTKGTSPASPVWASAELVSTDLSIGGLLRGRFTPRRIRLRAVAVTHRIDDDNRSLTHPPFRHDPGNTLPEVTGEDARLTLRQVGRPDMVVRRIAGSLTPRRRTARPSGPTADDPTWGPATRSTAGSGPSFASVQPPARSPPGWWPTRRSIPGSRSSPRRSGSTSARPARSGWSVDYDRPEGRTGPHRVRHPGRVPRGDARSCPSLGLVGRPA